MITRTHVLAELKRELGMRKKLYPYWLKEGKINKQEADHRTACIEEAIRLLQPEPQATQASMFNTGSSLRSE